MANLFWAYDESSGSFSPLPASPLLLPAIGLFFLLAIFEKMQEGDKLLAPASEMNIDKKTIQHYTKRYKHLLSVSMRRNLTESEESEMYQLEHPPWAKPGEVWTY